MFNGLRKVLTDLVMMPINQESLMSIGENCSCVSFMSIPEVSEKYQLSKHLISNYCLKDGKAAIYW